MDLTVPIKPIVMRPPNLKIWAERDYTVQEGMTKDESRRYTIGSEGAALTSDTTVTLYTQWLDHDGSPLPEGLGVDHGEHFGYTGRLAKIVSPSKLAGASQSDLALFAIAPGRHTQVVKVKSNLSTPEHYYIHVSGTPKDCNGDNYCPDFGTNGTAPPPYNTRPTHITPFLVPLYDEDKSLTETSAWRQLKQQQQENDDEDDIKQPLPAYAWQYRPEYQFSQYELAMQAINRIQNPGEPEEEITNLLKLEDPIISNDMDLIEVLYSLISSKFERLTAIDGKQELILALGEEEVRVTLGKDQTISFDNLDHLGALDAEDFLTMRLYTNNDVGNILWEWGFGLKLFPLFEEGEFSADEHSFKFAVFTPLPEEEVNNNSSEIFLKWDVTDGGSAEENTNADLIIHDNTINISTKAGTEHYINVEILASDSTLYQKGATYTYGPYTVTPGKAHHIEITSDKATLPADTKSTVTLTAKVFDQHDNLVNDETPVHWFMENTGELLTQQTRTLNGLVEATYRVDNSLSITTIKVESGEALGEFEISKTPLSVNLTASATSFPADQITPVVLSLSVSGSDKLTELPVLIESALGHFESKDIHLDSDGNAQINFYSPGFPADDVITVNVAGYKKSLPVSYLKTATTTASLGLQTIVAEANDGFVNVETLKGVNVHAYKTSTPLTVYGTPGEEMQISAGGLYTPNASPVLHYSMSELIKDDSFHGDHLEDKLNNLPASVIGSVTMDFSQSYQIEGTSLKFAGGYLSIKSHPSLEINDQLFSNIRFLYDGLTENPSGAPVLLKKGVGDNQAYQLELVKEDDNYYLKASIKTNEGLFSVQAEQPISLSDWNIAGFKYADGFLTLGINSYRISVPASGELHNTAQQIIVGSRLYGNIDDIKIGQEQTDQTLISLSQNRITIGADGSATINVQATGNKTTFGTRVGFLVAPVNVISQSEFKELQFVAKHDPDIPLKTNKLLKFLGISEAYAQGSRGCDAKCQQRRRDSQEQGVGLTDKVTWGAFTEWVLEEFLGEDVVNILKTTASFLYDMSSLSDIVTIVKAIIAYANDKTEDIDGLETTFAVMGVGITIIGIASGGIALPALKTGLKSFRGILKSAWNNLGPGEVLAVGVLAAKEMVRMLKLFISDSKRAIKEMKEFAEALGHVIKSTWSNILDVFVRSVNSIKDLRDFVFTFSRSSRVTEKIPKIADDAARFGKDEAFDVAKSFQTLYAKHAVKMAHLSEDALDGLAEVAHYRLGSKKGVNGINQLDHLFDKLSEDDLETTLSMVKKLNAATDPIPGMNSVMGHLASEGPSQIIGMVHTLKYLDKNPKITDRVVSFELAFKDGGVANSGRRIDLHLDNKLEYIEMKGSGENYTFSWGKKNSKVKLSARREFINDIIFSAENGADFKWVIAPHMGKDKDKFLKRMSETVGVPGKDKIPEIEMDSVLKGYLDELKDKDRDKYTALVEKIKSVRKRIEDDTLVEVAEY